MPVSGNAIIAEAQKLGKAARGYSETADGGVGPQYFDCSGLVQTALHDLGVSGVPRTSEAQWAWIQQNHATISKSQLAPGDLVFANFPGEVSPGHVGIYAGNDNVYSAEDQQSGIAMSTLSSWGNAVVGYGRVPSSTAGTGGGATGGGGTPAATYSDLGVGGVLSQASGLLKDVATVLDYVFGMFGRGQGWRLVFTLLAGVALYGSYKVIGGPAVVPV